jgi:hypothetical protein
MLFRELTPEQEKAFRLYSRKTYKPGSPIEGIWHPVCQDECVKINVEHSTMVIDEVE